MIDNENAGVLLAGKFKKEVLDHYETLSGIESTLGYEVIIDMWYLTNAMLEGEAIDVHHEDDGILVVLDSLPSSAEFMQFVNKRFDLNARTKP